jgi:iron complex outermembrane recepter protein
VFNAGSSSPHLGEIAMKTTFIKHSLLIALCTTSMIGLSAPAAAQAQAEAEESEDAGAIIVTARRRDETLQSTPVAITAIGTAQIENKGAVNIGDLMGAAPNLLITQQNSGGAAANLSIRGLTYADVEKSQEPTVGVVVDGVFIGTSTGQFFDFFDIKQIEVLRGPQGTLFGRNTIGGVINIQRTRPTGELGGKLEATYGSYKTWSGKGVFNVPIIEDGLAAKVWYFHNQSDGFYRHGVTGKLVGGNNNDNFGASFLVTPKGGDFDALLTVEKQIQDFEPVNSNLARTGELFCLFEPAKECNRNNTSDLYTVFNSPATSHYEAPSVTLEMNYDLGGVKLTSVSGYRRSTENQTQDFDASTADLYYTRRVQSYRQLSQELRAAGKFGDTFDYVVGGYLFSSKYSLLQHTRLFAIFNPAIQGVDPAIADKSPQLVVGNNKSYAVFGDFNWAFADKFRLSFGGRYTHDRKSLSNGFGGVLVGTGSAPFKKFTPKVGVDFRPNDDMMVYASWSRGYRSGGFSPRAATATTANVAYQPETIDTYEAGAKLNLFDRKLQFNLAAFYSDYKNLQQNTTIPGGPTGNQTITSNVGSATIKGVEVDFTLRPADGFRINGSLGVTDSKFKGFVAGNSIGNVLPTFVGTIPAGAAAILTLPLVGGAADPRTAAFTGTPTALNYSANNLIYSPKVTASINAEYTAELGDTKVVFNVGYRFIDRYDQQISLGPITGTLPNATFNATTLTAVTQPTTPLVVNGNDPRVKSDRQGLLDASISTKFDLGGTMAKFTVFGRNLANDRGTSAAFTVAGLWSFASAREPRTYGASLGFEF